VTRSTLPIRSPVACPLRPRGPPRIYLDGTRSAACRSLPRAIEPSCGRFCRPYLVTGWHDWDRCVPIETVYLLARTCFGAMRASCSPALDDGQPLQLVHAAIASRPGCGRILTYRDNFPLTATLPRGASRPRGVPRARPARVRPV